MFNIAEALKLVVTFLIGFKNFLISQKKKEIITIKDKALESRDQRELENVLSESDSSVDVHKYDGMYERPIKKKP